MQAEIITIGDEILIGQIIDTNSAWIAEQFNLNGIDIYQVTSVSDNIEHIQKALSNAIGKVDLVLITGGLGPTKDDITKSAICEFFNTDLVFHEPTFEQIKKHFKNRNIDLNKLNRDQALVPGGCLVLPNEIGTAPGLWLEKSNTIFISVPGVPFEMKNIVKKEVLPRLLKKGKDWAIFHKTILTQGLPESMLAEKIEDWEALLPGNIKLAYLPNPMSVRLRLSARGKDIDVLKQQVDSQIYKLNQLIPDYIFGYDNDTLAGVIGCLLTEKGKTVAVAESCTGGYISHLITSVPGSSEYFKGGIIAYSNDVKKQLLSVGQDTLQKSGAVSEPVVRAMAVNISKLFGTDYAIATSGIAGPAGGTDEKPVGTVWIAVIGPMGTETEKYVFGNNRERNIIRSSQTALQMLRRLVLKK